MKMIRGLRNAAIIVLMAASLFSCSSKDTPMTKSKAAAEILGNPEYRAISFGGYRGKERAKQPTVPQLKEDLKIMSAMGIKMLRTYNLQLPHAINVLKAIRELKEEDQAFEMYVILGAWMDCLNAWTDHPDHSIEDATNNESEIQKAVRYANEYPDIVKVIAVGNEAMVHWAASYFVHPSVILKYVNYLQELKKVGKLSPDLWITSSDNFASWGGGESDYHLPELEALINAVDYVSAHTYPFHDTHYNSAYWDSPASDEVGYSDHDRVLSAMQRAAFYAQGQYESVKSYVHGIDPEKPIHIGETGWSSVSVGLYGNNGSFAADEYKQALYHQAMRDWTEAEGISCFYFEAFDEQWKDPNHTDGSENHFGLITLDGKAKYALWESVDNGDFEGLLRGGNTITKSFEGDTTAMLQTVSAPKRRR
ncbi:MAG: glycosyl hydrolase family 17 protein [Schleiferiaceae bacterium]|nr:glycosyl hydrolase family 17 protein [Schleiferiaceae bacterium]MDG1918788.1 glycosyl hydrolase family 17 protein [Schleiferiaceae bacterium]